MRADLYPHQLKALDELETGRILCGGVGSGKSLTAIAYYFLKVCGGSVNINGVGHTADMKTPKNLYIITTAKKRDSLEWLDEAAKFGVTTNPENSFGRVRMVIDSWNNISKYRQVEDAFFIFDEQRLVGSGVWVKAFWDIAKVNDWILLSATPGDTWMDYIPVFVANGFYRNRSAFTQRHVVWHPHSKYPKVLRYSEEELLERLRKRILVDMPFYRHTKRIYHELTAEYDRVKFNVVCKDRWNPYKNEPIQEVGNYYFLMRRVVNEDPSRLQLVLDILQKHRKLIVFYNFNYERDILLQLKDMINVPIAEWSGHAHEPIPEGDDWLYLVQYVSGGEGWNCITTNAILFYSLNYSYRLREQAEGRIDRLNTPFSDLHYYRVLSKSPIDLLIMKAVLAKKDFNERSVKW